MTKPNITFCGLGAMGGGMAINLVKNGFPVTGFDLAKPLVEKLTSAGGSTASDPAAASKNADFLVIMVATMYQANSLLFEGNNPAIEGLQKDKTIVLCSTCPPTYPADLRKTLDQHNRQDVKLLDCPVSGGTYRAADGTLSIFASGPPKDIEHARDVLDCMSGNLYRVGDDLGAGQKVKAIHQLLAATNIISTAEALGLAAVASLDTQEVFSYIHGGADGDSFMFSNRGPHMLDDDWTPLSALAIIWKDAGIVCDAGREIRFPIPMANMAEQLYRQGNALNKEMLGADDARLVQLYLPQSKPSLVSQQRGKTASTNDRSVSKDTVNDLLAGIHLASSIEAMAFSSALGMSTQTMYEIISKAAGWNKMFVLHLPAMLEGSQRDGMADDVTSWTLAECEGASVVQKRLENAVKECQKLGFPSPMGTCALQQFYFAGLRR